MTAPPSEHIDWARTYREALAAVQAEAAGEDAGVSGEPLVMASAVKQFLGRVLQAATSGNGSGSEPPSVDSTEKRKRLAAIGKQLAPLVSVSQASKPRRQQPTEPTSARVGHLQLDLIARIAALGGAKGKSAKKSARSEIRGLLDRIALLLDAASPPSIAGEDEHSPFQVLVEGILAPSFEKTLPSLVRYLLKTYELLDDTPAPAVGALSDSIPMFAPQHSDLKKTKSPSLLSSTPLSPPGKDAMPSILSAMMKERSTKRPREEAGEAFKEMLLPAELRRQQKRRHSGRSERRSASSSSSSGKRQKATQGNSGKNDSASGARTNPRPAFAPSRGSTKLESMADKTVRSELLLAGVKISSRHPPELRARTSIDVASSRRPASADVLSSRGSSLLRARFSQQSLARSSTIGHSAAPRQPMLPVASRSKVKDSTPAPIPTSRSRIDALRSTVVMRTPDRPNRQQVRVSTSSSSGRVLVAASPPLRRLSSSSQQRVPPLLGGSTERRRQTRAPPPPLFK